MMMDEDDWIKVLQSGSLPVLQHHLSSDGDDVPTNLIHLACQHAANARVIVPWLVEHYPHQLSNVDESGRIPLHYVCQWRSLESLPVLHMLLTAAPLTIVTRWCDDDDDDGILPSMLAHFHGAPSTVVQYLLRRQLEVQHGLVLTHDDLCHLQWKEASFMEQVAMALQQTALTLPNAIQQISLVDCRLTYTSWQVLQAAMECLPAGHLQRLRLVHLHIWHSEATPMLPQHQLIASDMEFWQGMVMKHRATLEALELPHFYALSMMGVQKMAQFLAKQEFPVLQVLDARAPKDKTKHQQKSRVAVAQRLAQALQSPSCQLKSLAVSNLTAPDLMTVWKGMETNRSLQVFRVESIITRHNFPWHTLRQALIGALQRNTVLERVLGPRPLIHCPQVQLYLKLNREYRRREIGHWSPTLVAHVLAQQQKTTAVEEEEEACHYFPTHEQHAVSLMKDHHAAQSSAMFYILQARPDIVQQQQKQ